MKSPNFVIHATHSSIDAEGIRTCGFRVQSGRAVVSTDLVFACEFASDPDKRLWSHSQTPIRHGEPGRLVVLRIPPDKMVNYAIKTRISIDPQAKEVVGYVARYRYSRRQLAIYNRGLQTADVHIPPENVMMDLICSGDLAEIIFDLRNRIQKLERVNSAAFADRICKVIIGDQRNHLNHIRDDTDCSIIIQRLVKLTVESIWVNLIRSLSVDVMLTQGFTVYDLDSMQIMNPIIDKQFLISKLQEYKLIVDRLLLEREKDGLVTYLQKHVSKLLQDLESSKEADNQYPLQRLEKAVQRAFGRTARWIEKWEQILRGRESSAWRIEDSTSSHNNRI